LYGVNVVKTSHVEVHSLGKKGLSKNLSVIGQMTEGYEKGKNLSLHRKEVREAVLAFKLPIMSRVILVFAVNLSL